MVADGGGREALGTREGPGGLAPPAPPAPRQHGPAPGIADPPAPVAAGDDPDRTTALRLVEVPEASPSSDLPGVDRDTALPVVAGCTLLRPIARGGSAVVYLARQDELDRLVAVKVLHDAVADPALLAQLEREARTLAGLSHHPGIVTVHTAGRTAAGDPYLVIEFFDRGSLADAVATDGPLGVGRAAEVGVVVADALAAAHAAGVLHRDVKPSNVLVDSSGRVALGDFGIAGLVGHAGGDDVLTCTPEHSAPEVLRGGVEGTWSDVYALGSTLVSVLQGAPPFARGEDDDLGALSTRKELFAPTLPAGLPEALVVALLDALAPDPDDRPTLPQLREVLAAVAATDAGPVVVAPPPTLVVDGPTVPTTAGAGPAHGSEAPGDAPVVPGAAALVAAGGVVGADAVVAASSLADGASSAGVGEGAEPVPGGRPRVAPPPGRPVHVLAPAPRAPSAVRPALVVAIAGVVLALAVGVAAALLFGGGDDGGGDLRADGPTSAAGGPSATTASPGAAGASTAAPSMPTSSSTAAPAVPPATVAAPATSAPASTAPASTSPPAAPTSGVPRTTAPAPPTPSTPPPTTAAPTTAPPPPTEPVPTTDAPTTPTTAAPPTEAPETSPPVSDTAPTGGAGPTTPIGVDEAIEFVADYYDAVGRGEYELAWGQLSPEFQVAVPRTFERYVAFWESTDIDVRALTPTPGPGPGEAVVLVEARYTSGGRTVDEVDELTLRRAPDGRIEIVAQRIAG